MFDSAFGRAMNESILGRAKRDKCILWVSCHLNSLYLLNCCLVESTTGSQANPASQFLLYSIRFDSVQFSGSLRIPQCFNPSIFPPLLNVAPKDVGFASHSPVPGETDTSDITRIPFHQHPPKKTRKCGRLGQGKGCRGGSHEEVQGPGMFSKRSRRHPWPGGDFSTMTIEAAKTRP